MNVTVVLLVMVAVVAVVPDIALATPQEAQQLQGTQEFQQPLDTESKSAQAPSMSAEESYEELPDSEALRAGPSWYHPRRKNRVTEALIRHDGFQLESLDTSHEHGHPLEQHTSFLADTAFRETDTSFQEDCAYRRYDSSFPQYDDTSQERVHTSLDSIENRKPSAHNPESRWEVFPRVYQNIPGISETLAPKRVEILTDGNRRTIQSMTAEESYTVFGIPISSQSRWWRLGGGRPRGHRGQGPGRHRGRKVPYKGRLPNGLRQHQRPQSIASQPVRRPLPVKHSQLVPYAKPRPKPQLRPEFQSRPKHQPRPKSKPRLRYPPVPVTTPGSPTTTTTTTTTTADFLSVHNLAGPPYSDTIPPNLLKENITPTPPTSIPETWRPLSVPRPKRPYQPTSTKPTYRTTTAKDYGSSYTNQGVPEGKNETTREDEPSWKYPGNYNWYEHWSHNWNKDWYSNWSNRKPSSISRRQDFAAPTFLVPSAADFSDSHDEDDDEGLDQQVPETGADNDSYSIPNLSNHRLSDEPLINYRYPEEPQAKFKYPEIFLTRRRKHETPEANDSHQQSYQTDDVSPQTFQTSDSSPKTFQTGDSSRQTFQTRETTLEKSKTSDRHHETLMMVMYTDKALLRRNGYPEMPPTDKTPGMATTGSRYTEELPLRIKYPEEPLVKYDYPQEPLVTTRHTEEPQIKTIYTEEPLTKTKYLDESLVQSRVPQDPPINHKYATPSPINKKHLDLHPAARGQQNSPRPVNPSGVQWVPGGRRRGAEMSSDVSTGTKGRPWYSEIYPEGAREAPPGKYPISRRSELPFNTFERIEEYSLPQQSRRQAVPATSVMWQPVRGEGERRRGG